MEFIGREAQGVHGGSWGSVEGPQGSTVVPETTSGIHRTGGSRGPWGSVAVSWGSMEGVHRGPWKRSTGVQKGFRWDP